MPIANGYLHDGTNVTDVIYGYSGTPPEGRTFVAMSDPSQIAVGQSLDAAVAAAAESDGPVPMLLDKLVAKKVLTADEADDVLRTTSVSRASRTALPPLAEPERSL